MDLRSRRAILCDLDGCLIAGDRLLPGAAAFLAAHGDRLWIVSNNSTDTPATLSTRLAGMGLAVDAGRILLAGTCALDWIAARWPGAAVEIHGSDAIRAHAAGLGLRLDAATRSGTGIVLLTRDTGLTYASLSRLVARLVSGTRLVVANPDFSHPGPDGAPVPETGALLQAVLSCRPGLAHDTIGKPEPILLQAALVRAGAAAAEAVLIGDNPATDGEGARRLGIPFIRVDSAAGLAPLLERRLAG
ncbi:HAD-IIA family hydrolase [Marinibaculum pumilum]|uniref:HAD-IIA family hydrolase n=1 Tax=Marinibaculum pumilum TaxID=1766165 RepID=A0ABV7L034_9PROT